MTTISIIVPIYNAEQYLKECIDSILIQSHRDFELLLINDGSNDNSPQICEEYTRKDDRIKVLNQENAGVSAARNKGLSKAKGKYLAFVDADDYLEPTYLECLYNNTIDRELDFAYCGYRQFSQDKEKLLMPKAIKSPNINATLELVKENITLPLWVCLIKSSIVKNNKILFSTGCKYGEDQEFIMKVLANSNSISSINEYLYNYRESLGSAMAKRSLDHLDFPEAMIRVNDYLKYCNNNFKEPNCFTLTKIPESILFAIYVMTEAGVSRREIFGELNRRKLIVFLNNWCINWTKPPYIDKMLWSINPLFFLGFIALKKRIKRLI